MEGGANVVSEAMACGIPVLSTLISGSIGLLGPDYPGYFPIGDARALANQLLKCEQDPTFHDTLTRAVRSRSKILDPRAEKLALENLLADLKR